MQVKKKTKIAIAAAVAAGFGAFAGLPTANAGFTISFVGNGPTSTSNGYSNYVLEAIDDGAASTPLNNTGSELAALDVTITTNGGVPLGIEVVKPGTKYSGNLDGLEDVNTAYDGTTTYGTFIGIGSTFYTDTVNGPATTQGGTASLYLNTQTAPNNLGFSGTPAQDTKNQTLALLDPLLKNSGSTVNVGAVNNGAVTSLEVTEAATSGSGATLDNTNAVPFADIVVPTGTTFNVQGGLGGDIGQEQGFSINSPGSVVTSVPSTLTLTTTAPTGTSAGTLSLTGKNGSYVPARITGITGPASTTGYVQVMGFNPANDEEVYALEVDQGGTLVTGAALTAAIADLQSGAPAGVLVEALTAASAPNITGIFNPAAWNVEVVEAVGVGANPYFGYNTSNDTTDPGLSIVGVGVVPEPTGVGVLVLGGMGLMARRRRMAKGLVA